MKTFKVTGRVLKERNGKKKDSILVDALDKNHIWKDPCSLGFKTIFKVEEVK